MANNPNVLDNLTPFPKGVSGNPAGKPKGIPNAKTRYQRILTLLEDVKNPVTGELEKFTVMEVIDMKMMMKARNGDLQAYKEIMDRLEGKANQSVDLTSGGDKIGTAVDPVVAKEFAEYLKGKTKQ